VCRTIGVLHQCSRHVEVTPADFVLRVLLELHLNFWGENPRSDPKWLYLAMVWLSSHFIVEAIV
jgi:hypothetical protein